MKYITYMNKEDNVRELWKISYRSYRIFKREINKLSEYLGYLPVCRGRNLDKIGKIYGVKRKWWFLERDKKYRARILSVAKGGAK